MSSEHVTPPDRRPLRATVCASPGAKSGLRGHQKPTVRKTLTVATSYFNPKGPATTKDKKIGGNGFSTQGAGSAALFAKAAAFAALDLKSRRVTKQLCGILCGGVPLCGKRRNSMPQAEPAATKAFVCGNPAVRDRGKFGGHRPPLQRSQTCDGEDAAATAPPNPRRRGRRRYRCCPEGQRYRTTDETPVLRAA